MRRLVNRTSACQEATHPHEGRSPIRPFRDSYKVDDYGSGTSIERPEIGRMGVLPVMPELVDHLGEKLSQKIKLLALVFLTP